MADFERWQVSLTVIDGANRASTIQYYVPEATAKLYFAAADLAARAATAIGLLNAAIMTVTSAARATTTVSVTDEIAPVTLPAETVLRGNKLVLALQGGTDIYRLTIPARDATAYTPKADSIEVDFAETGDLATMIGLLESTAIAKNGQSVKVIKAYVND